MGREEERKLGRGKEEEEEGRVKECVSSETGERLEVLLEFNKRSTWCFYFQNCSCIFFLEVNFSKQFFNNFKHCKF